MTSNDFFKNNDKYFDLIYVDGDHSSNQVKIDLINSWNVLKNGGFLILDYYMWWYYKDYKKNPSTPINNFIKKKHFKYFKFNCLASSNNSKILNYNFTLFKALFLNRLASLIYLLTICVVLCPVIDIILLSSAPDSAATVAKPDLKL